MSPKEIFEFWKIWKDFVQRNLFKRENKIEVGLEVERVVFRDFNSTEIFR